MLESAPTPVLLAGAGLLSGHAVAAGFDLSSTRRFDSDTLQYFWDRYVGDNPELIWEYEKCEADVEVHNPFRYLYHIRLRPVYVSC